MDPQTDQFKPPYMSFQTFWNFLNDLSKLPLPPKLDRSIMSTKSGTDQNNLTTALTTFGLIDGAGVVQPALLAFADADTEGRKGILGGIVQQFYPAAMAVSGQNGTSAALSEAFKGIESGDTRRKAVTFFLHAAREAGLPLSPHFPTTRGGSGAPGATKAKRASAGRKKPHTPGAAQDGGTPGGTPRDTPPPAGHIYTVELASGGRLTLAYDVNLFDLDDEDMTFVLAQVKNLKGYQRGTSTADTGERAS